MNPQHRSGGFQPPTTGARCSRYALLLPLLLLSGCEQKMADQPRYEPLEASRFFADGMSARPRVPGTVPRDWQAEDPTVLTGRVEPIEDDANAAAPSLNEPARYVAAFPLPLDADRMQRGQERFGIYCAPCHGKAGTGNGPVVLHGYPKAATYYTARLREAPIGYLFDVATRGVGEMPAYGDRIPTEDRWLIVAYIRALQLSEHARLDELPDEMRDQFRP